MTRVSKAQELVEHPLPKELDYVITQAINNRLWNHLSESVDGSFRAFVITELHAEKLGKLGLGLTSHPFEDEDGELAHEIMGWLWWTHQQPPQNIKVTVEGVMDLLYVSPRGNN